MARATLEDAPGDDHIDPGQAPCVTHRPACGFSTVGVQGAYTVVQSGAVRVGHKVVIQAHVEEAFAAGTAGWVWPLTALH